MKSITFSKYHGAGNDFVMIDGSIHPDDLSPGEIARLCHRNFGIGADGLIIIEAGIDDQLHMKYYNADGSGGMMCANGARCAVAFAWRRGIIEKSCRLSCCGMDFEAHIKEDYTISIGFPEIRDFKIIEFGYFIDTGAPHVVCFEDPLTAKELIEKGRMLRYHSLFAPHGTNVNFVNHKSDDHWRISTYERGVENLTLACGTGAVAAAIAICDKHQRFGRQAYTLESEGGVLEISFTRTATDFFDQIVLSGPAMHVFSGVSDVV